MIDGAGARLLLTLPCCSRPARSRVEPGTATEPVPFVPTSDALEGLVGLPGLPSLHAIEELVLLGLSPMEALVAATRNAARVGRLLDSLGTVEVGKVADLVVLKADPPQVSLLCWGAIP